MAFRIDNESDHSGFNILGNFGFAVGPLDALSGAYPHSDPLWTQFIGLDLAPGDSFTFDFSPSTQRQEQLPAATSCRCEGIQEAEAILLRARELHPDNAAIEFNLACYASVTGRFEEAKACSGHAIELDPELRRTAIDDEGLRPSWDWVAGLP